MTCQRGDGLRRRPGHLLVPRTLAITAVVAALAAVSFAPTSSEAFFFPRGSRGLRDPFSAFDNWPLREHMPGVPSRSRQQMAPALSRPAPAPSPLQPGQREAVQETDDAYILYVAPTRTRSGVPARFDVRLTDGNSGAAGFRRGDGASRIAVTEVLRGGFRREYTIPDDVDRTAITARQSHDGVLTVTLPRVRATSPPPRVEAAAEDAIADKAGVEGSKQQDDAAAATQQQQPSPQYHAMKPFHEREREGQAREARRNAAAAADGGAADSWRERLYRPHEENAAAIAAARAARLEARKAATAEASQRADGDLADSRRPGIGSGAKPVRNAGNDAADAPLTLEADPDIEFVLDVEYDEAVAKDADAAEGFYDTRGEWQEY
mmetsp:Transcript_12497/g.43727  ORF Transcript_12497/g.43727 Transcript_12497/m.43727 type:complete len:379 (+) Transcript_12497:103-1239(+)